MCHELRAEFELLRSACGAPSVLFALVDVDPVTGREWRYAAGTGRSHSRGEPDGAADLVHAGSVSKVLTAIAVLRLSERAALDLDDPVAKWLPDLGDWAKVVTVRHLLQHRSGLPRESPQGHWWATDGVSLQDAVLSLAGISLRCEPGREFSYSNCGYAVLGRIVEVVQCASFPEAVRTLALSPLSLRAATFAPGSASASDRALGRTITAWGEEWAAYSVGRGVAPAGGLVADIHDLASIARFWLPSAAAAPADARLAQRMSRAAIDGYGFGCQVDQDLGTQRVRHAGTAPGFSTEIEALPEEGLAVAVAIPLDFANGMAGAMAVRALQRLQALRTHTDVPPLAQLKPLGRAAAWQLAGRYEAGGEWLDLVPRGNDIVFDPCVGIATVQRSMGEQLVSQDPASLGDRIVRVLPSGDVHDGVAVFARTSHICPPEPPPEILALVGEYGWPHAQIIVYEVRGKLGVVLDGHVRELPDPVAVDRYTMPAGTHGGESLEFARDAKGAITTLVLGGVTWPRIVHPVDGAFRIPLRAPLASLRNALRDLEPPRTEGAVRKPDLVDLRSQSPALRFDLRYASDNNFLGEPVYEPGSVPMLERQAADALQKAHEELRAQGFGLCVFDGYRPWSVTKLFWEATPDDMRQFVADPANGSRHNRGCAVDLTLYDLKTGALVPMPCGFDEFTARAYPAWPGGTDRQRWHRDLLRRAMERQGFAVFEYEWWHFDFGAWREFPVQNRPLR